MRQLLVLTALLGLGPCLSAAPAWGGEACTADVNTCIQETYEWFREKGWVGVELAMQESGRYRITRVVAGSPAAAAGLAVDDELLALDGIPYGDKSAAERLKAHYQQRFKPGNSITYSVGRGERTWEAKIVLGSVPEEVVECWLGRHLLQSHMAQITNKPSAEP